MTFSDLLFPAFQTRFRSFYFISCQSQRGPWKWIGKKTDEKQEKTLRSFSASVNFLYSDFYLEIATFLGLEYSQGTQTENIFHYDILVDLNNEA